MKIKVYGVTKEARREMGQLDWWDHLTDFVEKYHRFVYGAYLGGILGIVTPYNITTWQWWVICMPTVLLVSVVM